MAAKFNLTPRAKEDLRAIWLYTLRVWGETQADHYTSEIHERCGWLADQPKIGRHRPDIEEGYYCFNQGRHVIFYVPKEETIDIIGIPHREMDIENYFDGE